MDSPSEDVIYFDEVETPLGIWTQILGGQKIHTERSSTFSLKPCTLFSHRDGDYSVIGVCM